MKRLRLLTIGFLMIFLVSCSSVGNKSLSGESEYWKVNYTLTPSQSDNSEYYTIHEAFTITYKSGRSGGKITMGGGGGQTICGPVKGQAYVQEGGIVKFEESCMKTADEITRYDKEEKYSIYIYWVDSIVPGGSKGEGIELK
ncbi:hypothetical protein DUZ99_16610 [Xylanibacillus composti]|uniref:Lipoprotein n=1 Tax=Xylanibacillus composti TaxID=1572762 RepID=A0A8J4H5F5_9BACL|nr:hypothetical protein [Xylanibacillus composti]MDT9726601.1 hypothetical protein [Xylanibacillus composti]GIQ69023.1 hypothetical protein XYCOK13_18470 [Xylanibacillus composti]